MAVCDNPSLRIKLLKTLCRPCAGVASEGGVVTLCKGGLSPCARIYTQVRKQYVWTLCRATLCQLFCYEPCADPERLAQGWRKVGNYCQLPYRYVYIYIYIYIYTAGNTLGNNINNEFGVIVLYFLVILGLLLLL